MSPKLIIFNYNKQTTDTMKYFNRHIHMDSKTRRAILESITDLHSIEGSTWNLSNMFYGLFDGFDYSDQILNSKEIFLVQEQNKELYNKILTFVKEVKSYPKENQDVTQH